MDGFILRYFLIEWIRILDGAVLYTGRTSRTLVFQNIPGLSDEGNLEVPCYPFYTVNLSIGQDFYVGMPADLDQLGGKYSYRAVIGGEGLVKPGHTAAKGRCLVHQINLETRGGQIKRGLHPADPSTDNHYIAKMLAFEAFAHTICKTFANLVFDSV